MSDFLALYFEGTKRIELIKTEFKAKEAMAVRTCVRGKTAGAFTSCGSFQWTSAVRAVCAVTIRYALSEANDKVDYFLIGGHGSLASSLDYALSKEPTWITDMFGTLHSGAPYAKRLFKVTNPNRKRPGPVAVAINRGRLSPEDLKIYLNSRLVWDANDLYTILFAIEQAGETPALPVTAENDNLVEDETPGADSANS
jgi:hypothetical protein